MPRKSDDDTRYSLGNATRRSEYYDNALQHAEAQLYRELTAAIELHNWYLVEQITRELKSLSLI